MSRLLTYIGRFALILIGYAIAALAASTFLHVVSLMTCPTLEACRALTRQRTDRTRSNPPAAYVA